MYACYFVDMSATDRALLQDAVLAYYGLEDKNGSNHNAGDCYDGDYNNDIDVDHDVHEYEYEYDDDD